MAREVEEAMQIGFGWNSQQSAYQNMTAHRTRLANYASSAQSALSAASNLFASASSAQIEGMAKLAAQAGLARIQAQAKAKSLAMTQQIDHAQKSLDATKVAHGLSTGTSGSTVNTLA